MIKMNDYIYENCIKPMIKKEDWPILSRKDRYYICYKKKEKQKKMLLNIFLHMGTPCHRYCVCSFFEIKDIEVARSISLS